MNARPRELTSQERALSQASGLAASPAVRKVGMVLLGLATSAFCIWLATRKISLHDVGQSLSKAHYGWIIPCVVLTFITGWLRAVRWRMLFIKPESLTNAQSFGAVSIGLMFNNLLPSRAGEVPRLLTLRRATGISGFEVGMTIVVERLLDVFVLALAGVALWPFLP